MADYNTLYSFCILTDPKREQESRNAVELVTKMLERLNDGTIPNYPDTNDPDDRALMARIAVDPVFGQFVEQDGDEFTVIDDALFYEPPLIVADDPTGLWLYSQSDGNIESAALAAQWLLGHAPVTHDEVEFTWASTASKPEVGAFSGGACVVRNYGWEAIHVTSLLPVLQAKLDKQLADRSRLATQAAAMVDEQTP